MDIRLDAHGKSVEIADFHGTLEEGSDTAFWLWQNMEPLESEEELVSNADLITERSDNRTGFVDVSNGERLDVT